MVRGNKFKPQVVKAVAAAAVVDVAKEAEEKEEKEEKEEAVKATTTTTTTPPLEKRQKAVLVPLEQRQKKPPPPPPSPSPPPPPKPKPKKHALPTVVAAPSTPAAAGANWAAMRAARLVGGWKGAGGGERKEGDEKKKKKRSRRDDDENGDGVRSSSSSFSPSFSSFKKRHASSSPTSGSSPSSASPARPSPSSPSPSPRRPEAIDGAARAGALTRVLAVDCEMVGVGPGGTRSSLARVCVVNESGAVVLDTHVAQRERVVDHRTRVSGIRPEHLRGAPDAAEVRRRVGEIVEGRVLVGHAVAHDLKALMLGHPRSMLRDTARFPPLMRSPGAPGRKPKARKLRDLAAQHLGLSIQEGEHSPVDDARAALYLYQLHRKTWEAALKKPGGMRELKPPDFKNKKRKMTMNGIGGGGKKGGGAQDALARLAEQDDMVDL